MKTIFKLSRLFFKGLKEFLDSYEGILNGLEEKKKQSDIIADSKVDPNTTSEMMAENIDEIIRLKNEHEKMFAQLFGIFFAFLAFVISLVALMIVIFKK